MKTLFEIGDELLALDALIEDLGGDVSDPQVDAAVTAWMVEMAADEGRKLDGYVNYIRQLEMEAAAAKAEAEQYLQKAKTRENRVAWLKARVKGHLEATGRAKVVTATGRTLAIQTNGGKTPLVLDPVDVNDVNDRLCKTMRMLDQDAIRAALEAGEALDFARFGEKGTHLRVR